MAIDGIRVNLGEVRRGQDLKSKVGKDSVEMLLANAMKDPRFNEAKDQYEFRLRKDKNQAVLELRRKSTGLLSKMFGNARRSAERAAAYDAIRQHYEALPSRPQGDIRLNDARKLAAQVFTMKELTEELTETAAAEDALYRLSPDDDAVRSGLQSVMDFGRKDTVEARSEPKLDVRKQTLSLLERADVTTDQADCLRIRTPGYSGNGDRNLKIIHWHLTNERAASTDPAKLSQMVEGLLLQVRSGADRAIGNLVEDAMKKRFNTDVMVKTPRQLEFAILAEGDSVHVHLTQSAEVDIGPLGAPMKSLPFTAKIKYSMPMEALANAVAGIDSKTLFQNVEFQIARDADNLPFDRDDKIPDPRAN